MRKSLLYVVVICVFTTSTCYLDTAIAQSADKLTVLVRAKASQKLSAALVAVKLTKGDLVGVSEDGSAILDVKYPTFDAAKRAFVDPALKQVRENVPAKIIKGRRLIISFSKTDHDIQAAVKSAGLKVIEQHEHENGILLLVEPSDGITADLVSSVEKLPDLKHAELDLPVSIPPLPKSNKRSSTTEDGEAVESYSGPEWPPLPNDPRLGLWGMVNVGAAKAWTKVTGSPVIVADIDTGADFGHEDLKDNLVPGYDFITNSPNVIDENGHGTHTAGTIGAVGNNMKGVAGVCWHVKVMPVRFLDKNGSGSTFNAVKAIDFARQKGARVMSNSWGGGGYSQALEDAIARAESAGILFVAAAGNSNFDNDVAPFYPASYPNANIIAVAAIDVNDKRAFFSDFGNKSVHIGAPGLDVLSTLPKSGPLSDPSGYGYLSGTSMATPHVSGAAALLLGLAGHSYDRAPRIKALLLGNARVIEDLKGQCVTSGTLDIRFIAN
jgi:subtilisin family serine protease